MKKRNFLTTAALAALVAAQMAMPIMAAPATNQIPAGSDQHTTIGIVEASSKSAAQASFDIPMYLVVAAVNNESVIEKPTNYEIKNTATGQDANPIGVTKMQIENLADYDDQNLDASGWVSVGENGTLSNKRQIKLQLGSLWMPDTSTAGKNVKVDVPIAEGSTFRAADDNGDKVYKPIEQGKFLDLAVNGTVQATTRTDGKASSQFKVTYTVSPLDKTTHKPLSAVYVGDVKADAGLQ